MATNKAVPIKQIPRVAEPMVWMKFRPQSSGLTISLIFCHELEVGQGWAVDSVVNKILKLRRKFIGINKVGEGNGVPDPFVVKDVGGEGDGGAGHDLVFVVHHSRERRGSLGDLGLDVSR